MSEMKVELINMNLIFSDSELNCRGRIVPIDVVDLARSIDSIGLQQPIVVQPYKDDGNLTIRYRIVSGHRRHAAYTVLGKKAIECIIKADLTELETRKLNLEENLKRKDLNILQEAKAISHFKAAGWTEQQVATDLGMSRGWVQSRYTLLELPPEIQEEAAAGFLTQEHIKQLKTLKTKDQYEAVRRIKSSKIAGEKRKITIKEVESNPLAKRLRQKPEIFDMMERIQNVVGNNFGTRCLAWCAGEVNDFEIVRDLRDLAKDAGIPYEIPAEIASKAILQS